MLFGATPIFAAASLIETPSLSSANAVSRWRRCLYRSRVAPLSENRSVLRQAVDPGPPRPAVLGRFCYGAREQRREAAPQIIVYIAYPCEEAVEARPAQDRNGRSQSRLKIFEQPGEDQQSAVVRRPWRGDGIAAGRSQIVGDAGDRRCRRSFAPSSQTMAKSTVA